MSNETRAPGAAKDLASGTITLVVVLMLIITFANASAPSPPDRKLQARPAVVDGVADEATVQGVDRPSKGAKEAQVVVVEFSDFRCPHCGHFYEQVLSRLEHDYIEAGQVRFVYRHFSTAGGDIAAEASECAREQGMFWEMHDMMFANHLELRERRLRLRSYARDLGLDEAKFDQCLETGKYERVVQKDLADGKALGVFGTPTIFVNGKMIVGAQPFPVFEEAIKAALMHR